MRIEWQREPLDEAEGKVVDGEDVYTFVVRQDDLLGCLVVEVRENGDTIADERPDSVPKAKRWCQIWVDDHLGVER